MLVQKVKPSSNRILFGQSKNICHDVMELKDALPPGMSQFVLIVHAMSDNDTTSAFYCKTKNHIFEMIKKDISSLQYLKDLERPDCQPDEVAQIVERFLSALYRGSITKEVSNLDALRYELYVKRRTSIWPCFHQHLLQPENILSVFTILCNSGMVITWTPVNGHGRKMEMFCRQYVR